MTSVFFQDFTVREKKRISSEMILTINLCYYLKQIKIIQVIRLFNRTSSIESDLNTMDFQSESDLSTMEIQVTGMS